MVQTLPSKKKIKSLDEFFGEKNLNNASPKIHCSKYWSWLSDQSSAELIQAQSEADFLFRRVGITFNVYGDDEGAERLIPFDLIPRIISEKEWIRLEKGLIQRVTALNEFTNDVYGKGTIINSGVIPPEIVYQSSQYRAEVHGLELPKKTYAHISGIDLIRAGKGDFFVLEDNLRVPSGVSYMIENRKVMMRLFPEIFALNSVAPIEHYPDLLLKHLRSIAPTGVDEPVIVVLTPGIYNSAYFEHSYLAQQMGVELVEGQDLFVSEGRVFMKTTAGPVRVDVIYRRIDDEFLDPLFFRSNSSIGVPGILSVVIKGKVTISNAIGSGVADDKAVYPYVPDMIKFYLKEEPILQNVKTYLCRIPRHKNYVLNNLHKLVVKETHGAGGYGMLVGPLSTKKQISEFKVKISNNPYKYIAQPMLALSTCPTFNNKKIVPRHVDLRPFVLNGEGISIVQGGLTRVALKEGSIVVNSSQGGGTKDTWVVR